MTRDPRLDVFRGLALVTILIDHLPGNFWSDFTLGHAGLSDAAEGFVLISGISAGLAYGDYFRAPGQAWAGIVRIARRVRTIYLVQMLITALAIGLSLVLARGFDTPAMLDINRLPAVFADPQGAMIRIPLLAQHLDYVDILPMYLVLLAAAPLMLWLAWRSPWMLLALSIAVWGAATRYGLNLPNHTAASGWFFNPLTWQLIFTIGVLTGTALKDGRRLVPVSLWLLLPTMGILAFGFILFQVPPWSDAIWGWQWRAQQYGVAQVFIGLDKTFLPLPRVLHAVALAYVLSCFPFIRGLCASAAMAPLALLGRRALPIFAAISVLNFAMQVIRVKTGVDFALDTAMLAGALAFLSAFAIWLRPRQG